MKLHRMLCALACTAGCAAELSDADVHVRSDSTALDVCASEPTIEPFKELMVVDASVVRSAAASNATGATGGPLSFHHVMARLAGPGADVAAFTEAFFDTFRTEQQVGAFRVQAARDADSLLHPQGGLWRRTASGQLDMQRAPFRLVAVANRMDLADETKPNGEARLVFGLTTPGGSGLPMALIFEYDLPADDGQTLEVWAERWHRLGTLEHGDAYVAALSAVVEGFTAPEDLSQLRTNEVFMAGRKWELREYHLDQAAGRLALAPTALTPDFSLNNQPRLIDWVNANADAILADDYSVPAAMLGGAAFNVIPVNNMSQTFEGHRWLMDPNGRPLVQSEALRQAFARNTCNGCHQTDVPDGKTSIGTFYQISPLGPAFSGEGRDRLSPFILEAELPRRAAFLAGLLPCAGEPSAGAQDAAAELLGEVGGELTGPDGGP